MKLSCSRPYMSPTPVPKMPTGLVELMEGLSREVIKNNPSDIYNFCAEHMNKLLELREGRSPKTYLSLEQKINVAKNIVKQRAEQRYINYDKNMKMYKSQNNLTDNKSFETNIFENDYPHADKNPKSAKLKEILSDEIINSKDSKSVKSDIIISQVEEANERLIEKKVSPTTAKYCDTDSTKIESNNSIKGVNSDEVLSIESITADIKNPKEGKIESSTQEETLDFSDITDENVKLDFRNDMDIGTKINEKIKSEGVDGEVLDIKEEDNNDTSSNNEGNNQIYHNLENTTSSKEVAKTNKDLDIANKDENMPFNDEVKIETMSSSNVNNEITCGEEETDEIKSNNITIIEGTDNYVSREEAPKHNIVQYHEKVNDITTTEPICGYDSCEEALKNNLSVHNYEDVHDLTVIEETSRHVSNEVSPKNSIIVQRKTENIEEKSVEKSIEQKKFNVVEENNIKLDSLATNMDSEKNKEKLESPIVFSNQSVQKMLADSGLGLVNNDEQTVANIENDDRGDITSNILLNEDITNKEELKEGPLIKYMENKIDTNIKKDHSQNNLDLDILSANDEYDDDNNKQKVEPTDTNDVKAVDLERAAITIQKVFRNFLFRIKTSSFEDTKNTEYNGLERGVETKNVGAFKNHNQNLNKEKRAVGLNRMDTVLQTVNEEKSLSLSTDDSSTISSAATVIQAHIRGFLVRNRLNHAKTISNASLADYDDSLATSRDDDLNKNKTVLNIHIVPEGSQFISKDESLLTSVELSLDGSPPHSANLHPLGYDKSERRKQLKREDAIQSITPPSNNSRLSDEHDFMKEVFDNDKKTHEEQTVSVEEHVDYQINKVTSELKENDLKEHFENKDSESVVCKASENFTDESDVVTPFKSTEEMNSNSSNKTKLLHSGEFHDLVLPTKVSRNDTEVVSGE